MTIDEAIRETEKLLDDMLATGDEEFVKQHLAMLRFVKAWDAGRFAKTAGNMNRLREARAAVDEALK